jgi:hypothetical protein
MLADSGESTALPQTSTTPRDFLPAVNTIDSHLGEYPKDIHASRGLCSAQTNGEKSPLPRCNGYGSSRTTGTACHETHGKLAWLP